MELTKQREASVQVGWASLVGGSALLLYGLKRGPRFMKHPESVTITAGQRSHWVARGPAGTKVECDAVIINDVENELIGWRSLDDADVGHAGSVHFERTARGRGTRVRVLLRYDPPGGASGAAFAKWFGEEPSQQVEEDMRRFKQIMEAEEFQA